MNKLTTILCAGALALTTSSVADAKPKNDAEFRKQEAQKQEWERKKAEEKARKEAIEAEAKAKQEAEERENQRIAAEAKAKQEIENYKNLLAQIEQERIVAQEEARKRYEAQQATPEQAPSGGGQTRRSYRR